MGISNRQYPYSFLLKLNRTPARLAEIKAWLVGHAVGYRLDDGARRREQSPPCAARADNDDLLTWYNPIVCFKHAADALHFKIAWHDDVLRYRNEHGVARAREMIAARRRKPKKRPGRAAGASA